MVSAGSLALRKLVRYSSRSVPPFGRAQDKEEYLSLCSRGGARVGLGGGGAGRQGSRGWDEAEGGRGQSGKQDTR